MTSYPEELIPPELLASSIGGGDFRRIGLEFLGYFKDLCQLEPNEQVLDVGCGVGRMALALTTYMTSPGRYEGFDIAPAAIDWCSEQIAPRYPNFHFQLADVYNRKYNPAGAVQARHYTFPYEDEQFDFVFATSVFTHMLPDDVERYFSEIARVIRRGGRSLVTFYLLNDESLRLIGQGRNQVRFEQDLGTHHVTSKDIPGGKVALRTAYREDFVRGLYERAGLRIREPIQFGSWAGRSKFLSHNDVIVADR
jgi:SAM-dependent methyltransferase